MRVRWLESALASLRATLRRIQEENPVVAHDLAQRIKQAAARLESFPLSGRTGTVAGTREVVTARLPFIIVYRVTDTEVQILRVFHDKRARP